MDKKIDFPGNARSALGGTSIGNKGYIGLGIALHGSSRYNDFGSIAHNILLAI